MNKSMQAELQQYFPDLNQYQEQISKTEQFFKLKKISNKKLNSIFWNHLLSLIQRVITKNQNDYPVTEMAEISEAAKLLTKEYLDYMELDITPFEQMLLDIYTQKFLEKGE